ncbi:hypothetical protein VPH35_053136 [Triticum aestivum]
MRGRDARAGRRLLRPQHHRLPLPRHPRRGPRPRHLHGSLLEALGCGFIEADDNHSRANKVLTGEQMDSGCSLLINSKLLWRSIQACCDWREDVLVNHHI